MVQDSAEEGDEVKVRGKEIGKGEEANTDFENPISIKMKSATMKGSVL